MSKIGEGVPQSYKKFARQGGDVLWQVKIKGRSELVDGIPLHMSLKVFEHKDEMDLNEIKTKVKEFDLKTPDPKKLQFEPTVHTSERNGDQYYMLLVNKCDKSYEDFYNSMKHCGTVYKKFMTHVTIDKPLYEQIKKEGVKPEEIEFSPLSIEYGSGNTVHQFEKSENLEKSVFRNMAIGAGMLGAVAANPHAAVRQPAHYNSHKMLNAIAQVESSGGKNQNHEAGGGPIHGNEHAFGKYGLMPETIRETIRMSGDLKSKHSSALRLKGSDLNHYMQDNPGLEQAVAQKHLSRLEHHFGQDPNKIGYAWLEGIKGTYDAQKKKKDISSHWHVKKVNEAYSKEE